MAGLSITAAWNETAAFMAREARLVLPVGFMLIALPGAIVQAATPAAPPGELPEPGLWLALVPFAFIATLIGNLAISVLALRPGTSVGEAIQRGVQRFLPVFGAAMLAGLGLMLALVPVVLVAGAAAVAGGQALAVVPVLMIIPLLIFFWIRLLMLNPVGAAEAGGPVAILKRSWALTAGRFWQLLGFLVLLLIVALVASGAVAAVGGTLITVTLGPPLPDTLSFYLLLILSALVQAVLASIFGVMIARIYAQLAPPDPGEVFA